jgi:hypothetical protein
MPRIIFRMSASMKWAATTPTMAAGIVADSSMPPTR